MLKSSDLKNKKFLNNKSKEEMLLEYERLVSGCVVKINRNFVGGNLTLCNHSDDEVKKIKSGIISSGGRIVYELVKERNTYAHLGLLKEKINKLKEEIDME